MVEMPELHSSSTKYISATQSEIKVIGEFTTLIVSQGAHTMATFDVTPLDLNILGRKSLLDLGTDITSLLLVNFCYSKCSVFSLLIGGTVSAF